MAAASTSARSPAGLVHARRAAAATRVCRAVPRVRCSAHAIPLEYATTTLVQELVSTVTPSTSSVQPVAPDNFGSFVGGSDLTVVKFAAPWCGPCKIMDAQFAKLPSAFGNVKFGAFDCAGGPDHEAYATKNRIRSLPTFRIYRRGRMVDEVVGARPVELRQLILHHSW